jgi:PKD repeat protein
MKNHFLIALIILVLAVLGGIIFFSAGYQSVNDTRSISSPVKTLIGTISINASLPSTPTFVPIYRGYYAAGGCVTYWSPNLTRIKNNIPSTFEAPLLAQTALAPYGGLPPDAVLTHIGQSILSQRNETSGDIATEYFIATSIGYDRKINQMSVEGSGQVIRLQFGENGELLYLLKRWRTLEPIDQVPVISAVNAVEKLKQGEVLDHYQSEESSSVMNVNNISLGYYTPYENRPEITLEPVWIFSGTNADGDTIKYFVDARVAGSSLQFANFTASPIYGTPPLTVSFKDTSTGPIQIWQWDFGDGTSNWTQNPVHTYLNEGKYTVKLFVHNDERDNTITKVGYITVSNSIPPMANFTANITTGKSPVTIAFNDTSSRSPTSWFWEFGDETNATVQNPKHAYAQAGPYNVTLRAWNDLGSDTITKSSLITISAPAGAV